MKKEGPKLNEKELAIVGKYFQTLQDYENATKTCRDYEYFLESYHENPIPVHSRNECEKFPSLETLKITNDNDLRIIAVEDYKPKCLEMDYVSYISNKPMIKAIGDFNGIKIIGNYKSPIMVTMDPEVVELQKSDIYQDDIDLSYTKIKELPDGIFAKEDICSIQLPMTLTRIGNEVFKNCDYLKEIEIPESVQIMGISCFEKCFHLSSITIPSSVQSLGKSAFLECIHLTKIVIEDGLKFIGDKCFFHCKNLKEIHMPTTLTYLGDASFCRCTSLSEIQIQGKITEIQNQTFFDCWNLKTVKIPETVTKLGYCCFGHCTNLKTIYGIEHVELIDIYAFSNSSYQPLLTERTIHSKIFSNIIIKQPKS